MVNKYNHYHVGNFHKLLNVLNIKRRNLSDSLINYVKKYGIKKCQNFSYKTG
jgi:hypothetical protein